MTVKFVDELPRAQGRGGLARVEAPWRDELRGRPGRWALICEKPPKRAYGWHTTVRNKPGFEAAIRKNGNGAVKCYARYVGEPPKK